MSHPFPDELGPEIERPAPKDVLALPFSCDPGMLDDQELADLWLLFQQIGRTWNNVTNDSAGQRSSWLEFVYLRCQQKPSYLEEYRSALREVRQLVAEHGLVEAYRQLLLNPTLSKETKSPANLSTPLHHAKYYVVNEFIRVQIVAGGFRGFGGRNRPYNYNGFLRGTRYNRVQRVRNYNSSKDGKTR